MTGGTAVFDHYSKKSRMRSLVFLADTKKDCGPKPTKISGVFKRGKKRDYSVVLKGVLFNN